MSVLLLPITSKEDYHLLVPFCERVASRIKYTLFISTFGDQNLKLQKQLYASDKRVVGSEKNFYKTIENAVNNHEWDISFVCIYPGSVGLNSTHNCLRFFSNLRSLKVPYLLLPDFIKKDWVPKNIFFPISSRDGEKEASAWAGFWTRNTGGKLHIAHPQIKSRENQKKLITNVNFIKRLLNKSGISYDTLSIGYKKKEIIKHFLQTARNDNQSLLILPAHRLNSPEYIFTGPPEKKVLKNRGNTPVLFVNPRHDLYLPCG